MRNYLCVQTGDHLITFVVLLLLQAGEKGTVLVASIHGGPCYVFDIPKRTCLYKLNLGHLNSQNMLNGDVVFTNDDAYLVFEVKTRPQKAPEGSRDVYMPLCWDLQRSKCTVTTK